MKRKHAKDITKDAAGKALTDTATTDDRPELVESASRDETPQVAGSGGIEELKARVAELEDQLLRAKAEQQNIRKRAANELADALKFANASVFKHLLGTVDDFDRTLAQVGTADAKSVLDGVRLIYDNFMKVLRDSRVEVVEAEGQPFDPRHHEAVQQVPAAENQEPGTVVAVLQRGFTLGDRVLRPAKVVIAAHDQDSDAEPKAADAEADTVAKES